MRSPPLFPTTHVHCSAPGAGDTRPRHHHATAMHEANPPRRRRAVEPERTLRRSNICPAPPALHAAAQRVRQVASRFFITRAVSAQPLVPPCVRPCSAPRAVRAHTDAPALPPACHTRGASWPPISARIAAPARNRKPAHIAAISVEQSHAVVRWLSFPFFPPVQPRYYVFAIRNANIIMSCSARTISYSDSW